MFQRHAAPVLSLRAAAEGVIEGFASVFDVLDSYGETIAPGAFSASLARHQAAGTAPAMLWSHASDRPIGSWREVLEDKRGLRARGQLNLATAAGREAFEHLRAGDASGLSIGFYPRRSEPDVDGGKRLLEVDLVEISAVVLPANPAARVTSVRSLATPPATVRELEEALRDMGFSRRAAASIAARGFEAQEAGEDPTAELEALHRALSDTTAIFR